MGKKKKGGSAGEGDKPSGSGVNQPQQSQSEKPKTDAKTQKKDNQQGGASSEALPTVSQSGQKQKHQQGVAQGQQPSSSQPQKREAQSQQQKRQQDRGPQSQGPQQKSQSQPDSGQKSGPHQKGGQQQRGPQSQPEQAWGQKSGPHQGGGQQQRGPQSQPEQAWGQKSGPHQGGGQQQRGPQSQPEQAWGQKSGPHQGGGQQQRGPQSQPEQAWGQKSGPHQGGGQQQRGPQSQPEQAWGQKSGPHQGGGQQQRGPPSQQKPQSQPEQALGQKSGQQPGGPQSQTSQQRPHSQPEPAWGKKQGQQQQARGPSAEQQRKQERQPSQSSLPRSESSQSVASGVTKPGSSRSSSVQSVQSGLSKLKITPPSHGGIGSSLLKSKARQGTRGQRFIIETNFVDLILDRIREEAFHYDIKFDPDKPKRLMRPAFIEFQRKVCPNIFLAFDGQANVYSPVALESRLLETTEVTVVDPESQRSKEYKVTLQETLDPVVDLSSLKTYNTSASGMDKPMRALQCLDVVLRNGCFLKGKQSVRSFYRKPSGNSIPVGDGCELWLGLFQAAVLGQRPLLNIDVSHKAFTQDIEILRLMEEVVYRFDRRNNWETKNDRTLHNALVGTQMVYQSPAAMGGLVKIFKYNGLKGPASQETFKQEDGRVLTIQQYFQERGYKLQFPHLPCVHVGSLIRNIYLPVELCRQQAGTPKKDASVNQVRAMIKSAATDTVVRKQKIMSLFNHFNHNNDPTVQNFGVALGNNFIQVEARLLDAPKLDYHNGQLVFVRGGKWDPRSTPFIEGAKALKWSVWITDRKCQPQQANFFGKEVVKHAKQLGMNLDERFDVCTEFDYRNVGANMTKFKQGGQAFAFVIISKNDYAKIKKTAEIQCGLLTQCIQTETILRKINPSTVTNILLKVNAKLNGLNHTINARNRTNVLGDMVMLIGADVTHAGANSTKPSVVGTTASYDNDFFKYNMRWRIQNPNNKDHEMIHDMENIVADHLQFFKQKRGKLPKKIVYYRDGVSEGQFEALCQIELGAMRRAMQKIYGQSEKPKLTCVVVQKRHHARFFPPPSCKMVNERDRFKNCPPGTIVDTVITHPKQDQFFLQSHESIQGTARPTKYCVILDESNFDLDDLQAATYNLCHMFTRCNRAVSYPAPTYYAHLAAARGAVYTENEKINFDKLDVEHQRRQVKTEIFSGHPMYFV